MKQKHLQLLNFAFLLGRSDPRHSLLVQLTNLIVELAVGVVSIVGLTPCFIGVNQYRV